MKKIVITGATGSIGRRLVQALNERGDEITIFTRSPKEAENKIAKANKYVKWDYNKPDEWRKHLIGVDAVIHFAGANLSGKRWTKEYKKLAYDSRVISTRNLVKAIRSLEQKPKAFICANAVGYYGNRFDEILSEDCNPGADFLARLCSDWAKEAKKVEQVGVRSVSVLTGLVLVKDEGIIKQLNLPFKLFVGGPLAGGKQWFPWIHVDDIIGIYLNAIDNDLIRDYINAASPEIVRMKEFAKVFGKVLKRPSIFPIPKIVMKIIAGEIADYAVMSQRVSMNKVLKTGYKFKFENLEVALRDVIK